MALGPLKTIPIYKERVWGGDRLATVCGKRLPAGRRIGESWELSVRGEDTNVIASGSATEERLDVLFAQDPVRWLGAGIPLDPFPLLIKLLDATDRLSVQVHPDDAHAARLPGTDRGKWETWVILETVPGASLYRGFRPGVDRQAFIAALEAGVPERCLQELLVAPGDVIDLPPGTPHAIGAGILLAEIQQNSDWTFRVHDWGRVGLDGRPRELHLERALEAFVFDSSAPTKVEPSPLSHLGAHRERLVANQHFELERWTCDDRVRWPDSRGTFEALLVVAGKGKLIVGSQTLLLSKSDTILLPAERAATSIEAIEPLTILRTYPFPKEPTR